MCVCMLCCGYSQFDWVTGVYNMADPKIGRYELPHLTADQFVIVQQALAMLKNSCMRAIGKEQDGGIRIAREIRAKAVVELEVILSHAKQL